MRFLCSKCLRLWPAERVALRATCRIRQHSINPTFPAP